jgi:hypothetical protein
MLDITRDPPWGRIAETLGEDPYVTSTLGAAMVRGFQGSSLDAPDSIAACAKHYVGYGAAEGSRDYNTTWIPRQRFSVFTRQNSIPSSPRRDAQAARPAANLTGRTRSRAFGTVEKSVRESRSS